MNGFLTDLSITTVDNLTLDCHKAPLIAKSGHFKQMFDDCSFDVGFNVIDLDTTSDVLKDALQFIYKDIADLHAGNVESLLVLSNKMELHQLTQQCKNYMEKNLSVNNVMQYHEHAMSLQDEPLSTITYTYIKNECLQLLSTKGFAKLHVDNLKSLLTYLNRFSSVKEYRKLDIILQWKEAHGECSQTEELLNAIRFNKLSIHCLKYYENGHLLGQRHKMLIKESLLLKYKEQHATHRVMLEKHEKTRKHKYSSAHKQNICLKCSR